MVHHLPAVGDFRILVNRSYFKPYRNILIKYEGGCRVLSDNRGFVSQQLMWIAISLGISLAISFIVPFPYSLPIIIGVFILLSFYMRKRAMRKMGMSGTSLFGGSSSSVNYYCMSCGTKHNQAACPRCGSKMKRVGS